jgi:hypothetical protein
MNKLVLRCDGRVGKGNQSSGGVIFLANRDFWLGIYDGQNFPAMNSANQ